MSKIKRFQLGLLMVGALLLFAAIGLYLSGLEHELLIPLALAGAVFGFCAGGLSLMSAQQRKSKGGWDKPNKDPLTKHIDGL